MRDDKSYSRVNAKHYTAEQRDKIMQEYQDNKSVENLHKVIESSLRLVHVLVYTKFWSNHIPREDLMQTGYLALIKAIEGYNPKAGMAFSSYVMWHLQNYVGRYIKKSAGIVSPPINSQFWSNKERVLEFRRLSHHVDLYGTIPNTNDLLNIDVLKSDEVLEDDLIQKDYVTKVIKLVRTYYKNKKNARLYRLILDNILGLNSITKDEIAIQSNSKVNTVDFYTRRLLLLVKRAQYTLDNPPLKKKAGPGKSLGIYPKGKKFCAWIGRKYLGTFPTYQSALLARRTAMKEVS